MATKDELIDLFRSLASASDASAHDFALAALEYASTVLNRSEPQPTSPSPRADPPRNERTTPAYSGPIRLCLDFGTAMSKAFAWNQDTDVAMPLRIGEAAGEPGSSYALNSTMFISRDGRVYFGQQAVQRAAAVNSADHRPMDSIKDFLTVGSEFGLVEPVSPENNPTTTPLRKKDIISLYLGFLTDNALLALEKDHGEPSRDVPRTYTKPVFDQQRDEWATDVLNHCANVGQMLADHFGGQWSDGLDLRDVHAALRRFADDVPSALVAGQHILPEPVAAFASRLPDDTATEPTRRLCIVIDVGAGTTDFAAFAVVERGDEKRTVFRIKHSVATIRIAGDAVDNVLMDHLLERAGVTEGHSQIGAMRADLRRDIRLVKENLFVTGFARRQLVNDQVAETTRDAFEQSPGMVRLSELLQAKYDELRSNIDASWSSFPSVEVLLTGGGSTLKMVTDLVKNPIRPPPDWLSEVEDIRDQYPQLAVSIGGAYHGAGFTGIQLDRELERFGGDLPYAEWTVEVVRKGQ